MATYTLPQPALHFGSDSRGFTDPLRYSSQRPPRLSTRPSSIEQAMVARNEGLPNVNQLLSPSTQPSIPPSPYRPQHSPLPPKQITVPDGHTYLAEQPTAATVYSYQGAYPTPMLHSHIDQLSHKPLLQNQILSNGPSLNQAYVTQANPSHVPFQSYSGPSAQMTYPAQPHLTLDTLSGYSNQVPPQLSSGQTIAPKHHADEGPAFPLGAAQYYPEPSNTHVQSGSPAVSDDAGESSFGNPVKLQPRVVREDIIPGEGPVWVYEDGSTCPKIIDGEAVNAHWGVTKAGRPRKRLAIACTTCREKKIKCDPAMPKCAQCEKFGRNCHYATA